ncbi:dimethylaniline monooxygenase 2 [Purpureocillium lavendulum]|uniref:Dimethylaniline monooxygenase 2 n=1 Tax=Purpureocillium lavendulum TaxID=1247861 RepID=A0AB34FKQ9_9HYPO|nr:dimethylaniline monooxygenase 2 [Purpureocillium lavendulum]
MDKIRVAVIGGGSAGLTALKALREEGFDAVGFERKENVGGLWSYSSDSTHTSVIQNTIANVSKFISGFSDFPIPRDFPCYMTGAQVAEYFQAYARHFELESHIRFKTIVQRVLRDKTDKGWDIYITGPEGDAVLSFDKVVFATGAETLNVWPPMTGREKFKGTVIHGQSYRGPEQFVGKRILVVGVGNTACDVSLSLKEHASKLFQSYRRGRVMVSRYLDNGVAADSTMTWPALRLKYLFEHKLPWLAHPLLDRSMTKQMIHDAARASTEKKTLSEKERRRYFAKLIKDEWRLLPSPSMAHEHPVIQETFIATLSSGQITPVRGFKEFAGEDLVLLDDGSFIEVDVVIFCTGYGLDFSIMPELEMDGTCGFPMVPASQVLAESRREPYLPRLYHMMFPPRWASSVAFLSWMSPQITTWCVFELASLAIAQIWATEAARELNIEKPAVGYRTPAMLPSLADMNAEVDEYHAWWRGEWAKEKSARPGFVRPHTFYRFLHDMAGTEGDLKIKAEVNEYNAFGKWSIHSLNTQRKNVRAANRAGHYPNAANLCQLS